MGSCCNNVSCLLLDYKKKYPSCSLSFILYLLVQVLAKAYLFFGISNTSVYNLTLQLHYWWQGCAAWRLLLRHVLIG